MSTALILDTNLRLQVPQRALQAALCLTASAASDFVTGTAIPVDGGFSVMG